MGECGVACGVASGGRAEGARETQGRRAQTRTASRWQIARRVDRADAAREATEIAGGGHGHAVRQVSRVHGSRAADAQRAQGTAGLAGAARRRENAAGRKASAARGDD